MFIFDKAHMLMAGKIILTQLVIFASLVLILWGTQKLYSLIDPVSFPEPAPVAISPETTENEKGIMLVDAITHRLRYELKSTFGWSANDILFSKWVLDNRAYRQFGVYNSTKILFDHYSTTIAKLGGSSRENDDLYAARMNQFAISPARWGILFFPSAESSYKKGLSLVEKYKKDLITDKAIYNCRPDDIYASFNLILSDKLLGYAIGLLQNSQNDSFYSLDNRIYEVQGMVLVIRDVVNALYILYPDVAGKNNEENFSAALDYLNRICTYNPLFITSALNSGELMISYLLFAKNRLEDIRDSIRI